MRKRPLSLFICAMIFLYFPAELLWQSMSHAALPAAFDVIVSVVLPLILSVGLIKVNKVWWYTLIALVMLWGVNDLHEYYESNGGTVADLSVHMLIYAISLAYFINPRIRHLYFDPRLRWWRAKRRYETQLPLLMRLNSEWYYPVLRNVSEGGCFVETNLSAEVNSSLQIVIPLPVPLGVSAIRTDGLVRWVSRNPLRLGVGIQFSHLSRETRRALKRYVSREL